MTNHDDGESDDPQLQSLRAVWLAMPDEDPPERGLAELMAAARVKAEQMATPSLWQRISALLRRPPVLAFATVLVLIGGGVLIGRRGEQMQAVPEVDQERSRAAVQTATIPAGPALGSGASEDEEAPTGMAEPMIPEPTFEPEKKDAAALTHRPASPKKANLVGGKKEESADKAVLDAVVRRDEKPAEKPSAAKPPAAKSPAEKQFAERPTAASDDFSAAPAGGIAAEPAPEATAATRGAGAAKTGAAESTATQPAPSRTAQVLAQAKAAIARGDCATARALLKRVASEDANAYRKALASDASLKSCVTAAQ